MIDEQNQIELIGKLIVRLENKNHKLNFKGKVLLCLAVLGMILLLIIGAYILFISENNDQFSENILLFLGLPLFIIMALLKRVEETMSNIDQRIRKLNNSLGDVKSIIDIVDSQDFTFYLRDFQGGRNTTPIPTQGSGGSGVAMPLTWPRKFGKEATIKILSHSGFDNTPILMLNNLEEGTNLEDAKIIYATDDNWLDYIRELIPKAQFVIIDFDRSYYTNNIKEEIRIISNLNRRNVIVAGKEEDIEFIKSNHPEVVNLIYKELEV